MSDGLTDNATFGPDHSGRAGFDAEGAAVSTATLRRDTTVVLLLPTSSAEARWAANTATALCARWATDGQRVVLADLSLEDPILHGGLDVANLEGLVDIFLYGASLSRIAQPVRDGAFYLIPAGTYAPDGEEIYGHPRWKKLVAGFRETDATLALFVPPGTNVSALAKWVDDVVVLGPDPAGSLPAEMDRLGLRILATLGGAAPATYALEPDPDDVEAHPTPMEEFESVSAERERAAAVGGPSVPVHRAPDSELELPPPPLRHRHERRTSRTLLWLLLLVILAGLAGYYFATMRPDLLRRLLPTESTGIVATSEAAVQTSTTVEALSELLPYSVQVRAYTTLDAAREQMEESQQDLDSVAFFVSPEEIQGILYFRILSGLAADTAAATSLRDRLVDAGAIEEEDATGSLSLVQFTPLAFELGEFETPSAAAGRADELWSLQIPTYPAAIDYSDGSTRWRLYAGAYADSASASGLREMLETAGIEPVLTARTGSPLVVPE